MLKAMRLPDSEGMVITTNKSEVTFVNGNM